MYVHVHVHAIKGSFDVHVQCRSSVAEPKITHGQRSISTQATKMADPIYNNVFIVYYMTGHFYRIAFI